VGDVDKRRDVFVRDQIATEDISLYENGAYYVSIPEDRASTALERMMRDVFEDSISPTQLRQTEISSLRQKDGRSTWSE
jgi:hypothetical protein